MYSSDFLDTALLRQARAHQKELQAMQRQIEHLNRLLWYRQLNIEEMRPGFWILTADGDSEGFDSLNDARKIAEEWADDGETCLVMQVFDRYAPALLPF